MLTEICSFWIHLFPSSMIVFFYRYTFFFVIGAWLLFFGCCLYYKKFIFLKSVVYPFLIFIGGYTVITFFDSVNYVLLLFQDPQLLWGSLEGIDLPAASAFYADAAGHIFFDEQIWKMERSIYWQTALSIPIGFTCILFYALFLLSLLRKKRGFVEKGGQKK